MIVDQRPNQRIPRNWHGKGVIGGSGKRRTVFFHQEPIEVGQQLSSDIVGFRVPIFHRKPGFTGCGGDLTGVDPPTVGCRRGKSAGPGTPPHALQIGPNSAESASPGPRDGIDQGVGKTDAVLRSVGSGVPWEEPGEGNPILASILVGEQLGRVLCSGGGIADLEPPNRTGIVAGGIEDLRRDPSHRPGARVGHPPGPGAALLQGQGSCKGGQREEEGNVSHGCRLDGEGGGTEFRFHQSTASSAIALGIPRRTRDSLTISTTTPPFGRIGRQAVRRPVLAANLAM